MVDIQKAAGDAGEYLKVSWLVMLSLLVVTSPPTLLIFIEIEILLKLDPRIGPFDPGVCRTGTDQFIRSI